MREIHPAQSVNPVDVDFNDKPLSMLRVGGCFGSFIRPGLVRVLTAYLGRFMPLEN